MAVAYAEAGQFDEGIPWQKKALADKDYEREDGENARKRLKLYDAKNRLENQH